MRWSRSATEPNTGYRPDAAAGPMQAKPQHGGRQTLSPVLFAPPPAGAAGHGRAGTQGGRTAGFGTGGAKAETAASYPEAAVSAAGSKCPVVRDTAVSGRCFYRIPTPDPVRIRYRGLFFIRQVRLSPRPSLWRYPSPLRRSCSSKNSSRSLGPSIPHLPFGAVGQTIRPLATDRRNRRGSNHIPQACALGPPVFFITCQNRCRGLNRLLLSNLQSYPDCRLIGFSGLLRCRSVCLWKEISQI